MRRVSLLFFVAALLLLPSPQLLASPADPIITTVAGGGPDGIPAKHANLLWPNGVAFDAQGILHFTAQHRVYRLTPSGIIQAVAGIGAGRGFDGDGLPALNTNLYYPSGLAFDGAGNLFIADSFNARVRRVDALTGIITTVAGGGTNDPGDGGPATAARLWEPTGLALDAGGNLYFADYYAGRVRRVDALTGTISTVAGGGSGSGNGVPATLVNLLSPAYLALDPEGSLFISEAGNRSIRKVDAVTHLITTVVSGVQSPSGLALDAAGGFLYFAADSHIYRLVLATSAFSAISGSGTGGYSGDDGVGPVQYAFGGADGNGGLALDKAGHLFIGDSWNYRVRRLNLSGGAITTVAGNGGSWHSEDGFPAPGTYFNYPDSATLDHAGNLYIAEQDDVRRVDAATGLVSTPTGIPAGGGAAKPLPNGSLAIDSGDNLYIGTNTRILRRDAISGVVEVVAGTGSHGFGGDGGPATAALLSYPYLGTVDALGNLYFADLDNHRIRRVDGSSGIITTVAGNGSSAFGGDGGPAVSAGMEPCDVAVDTQGNLYIADCGNHRIRRVDAATGTISTYAGTGSRGYGGDGIPATSSDLDSPSDLALDPNGNLYLSAGSVRRVDALTGTITTVAGSSEGGFYGDGGPATAARLGPGDLSFDAAGNLYIGDYSNFRVRKVAAADQAPVAAAGADSPAECVSPSGAPVRLDGSGSSDADSTAGTNDDIAMFEWFENYGATNQALLGTGEILDVTLPLGPHLVTLRVTDKASLSDTDEVEADVVDTTPPEIAVALSPTVLFPPDHRLHPIHATVTAVDRCGVTAVALFGVTSSETSPPGQSVPRQDIHGADPGAADYDFELRAARSGAGPGRTYTVTYQATDGSGHASRGSAVVVVPHDRRRPTPTSPGGSNNPPRLH